MSDFFLQTTDDPLSGWLGCLGTLYAGASYNSTLNLSMRAAAYAYMANKRADGDLRLEGKELYGRALLTLKEDLGKTEIARGSATLAAALVLGMYEVSITFLWL